MTERSRAAPCPRCNGRMFADGRGDLACFTCGHVRYSEPPEPPDPGGKRERRPSHAGQNLG